MRRLGDKIAAKLLAERVGVPVSPWSGGAVRDDERSARAGASASATRWSSRRRPAAAAAASASSRALAELAEAFRVGRRRGAHRRFGDGRLFLERKIDAAAGTSRCRSPPTRTGTRVALGCRDCSVQRRHQKVIEEAPPPGLAPQLLAQLQDAAARGSRDDVGYVGVGTVEFLVARRRASSSSR